VGGWWSTRPTFRPFAELDGVPRDNVRPDYDQMVSTPQQATVQNSDESVGLPSAPFLRRRGREYVLTIGACPVSSQVYMDQTIFSPLAVAYFFGCMSVLEGKGLGEAGNRINHVRQQGFTTLASDW